MLGGGAVSKNEMLDYAKFYAGRGLRVFPCEHKGKKPITRHGCHDATCDFEQAAKWWQDSAYNIGIATGGGLVVLDVDINHQAGKYGDETLTDLEKQYGELPPTWQCLTGGGGIHYYFKCDDETLTVGANFAPGLDYRAGGGYVIAPPSIHANGRTYEWEVNHNPIACELAPLPEWLHKLMRQGKGAAKAKTQAETSPETPDKVFEGARNQEMFKLAASLRAKGLTLEETNAALQTANLTRCNPPLTEKEIWTICKSVGKYERGTAKPTSTKQGDMEKLLALFKPLTDFPEEEAKWLVPGWIPEGQISVIAADGGIGKTTLWCHIIAALSNGANCILDPPGFKREPKQVCFMTTEDSVRKKLRQKLRLAGANMDNIITPDFPNDRDGLLRKVKFGTPEMEEVLREFKPVLCIFDPVQGFTPPNINMGSRNEMRDCLAPLVSIGEDINTTALIICHTNKRKGASGRERIADSADLWDIARSVMMAGFTDEQGVRYLSNEKNNYGQQQETILFTIDDNGQIQKAGTSWKRDRDYIQGSEYSKSAPVREDCKAFILKTLNEAGGSMPTAELEAKASAAGYSFSAIKRAKQELKAEGAVKHFSTGSARNGDRVWHIKAIISPEVGEPEEQTGLFEEWPPSESRKWSS